MEVALPTQARYVGLVRRAATSVMRDIGAPDDAVADVQIALTEACANVVRHAAGGGAYVVAVDFDEAGCEIAIVDRGPGVRAPQPPPAASVVAENGRGLRLIDTLVDELELASSSAGTQVWLVKRWEQG